MDSNIKGYVNISVHVFSSHLLHSTCRTGIRPLDIFFILANCYLNTWYNLKRNRFGENFRQYFKSGTDGSLTKAMFHR